MDSKECETFMKTKRSITSDRKIETTGLRKDITMSERENIMILLAHIINPRYQSM